MLAPPRSCQPIMPRLCTVVVFAVMLWAANRVQLIRGFASSAASFWRCRHTAASTCSSSVSSFHLSRSRGGGSKVQRIACDSNILFKQRGYLLSPSSFPWSLVATRASSDDATTQTKKKSANTGGLRRLPVVSPAADLLSWAKKDAQRIKGDR